MGDLKPRELTINRRAKNRKRVADRTMPSCEVGDGQPLTMQVRQDVGWRDIRVT